MKIKSLMIQNFRGYYEPQKIVFDDLTLIVGKNDVGKSTALEALDIFFGNRKVDKTDLNINCNKDEDRIYIAVEFCNLPISIDLDEGARTELSQEFLLNKDGYLEIKKIIIPGSQAQPKIFVVANCPLIEQNLLILKNAELKKLAMDLNIDKSEYSAAVNNSIRKAIWSSVGIETLEEREVEIDKEDGKAIFAKLEQEMPVCSLFSVDRKNSDQDSEIQDPIKSSIKQIIKELELTLDPIKSEILGRLDEIAKGTIEKLNEMNPEIANTLKPVTEIPAWEKAFSVTIESDGIPLNKRGSGVKRLVLINFFRNEAERLRLDKQKGNIVYAIEEPETSQHPDWQIKLFDALKELSDTGHIQIILTSHHPELTGLVPLSNIRLIKKIDSSVKVESSTSVNHAEIAKTLGVLPRIDGVKIIVCLEGPNDVRFIKNIAHIFNVDRNDERILWLPVGGMTLRDFVNEQYLKNLKKPEVHFYDRDKDSKYKSAIEKAKENGSWAELTQSLTMENYFHPILYKQVWTELRNDFVDLSSNDWVSEWRDKNIPLELSAFIKAEFESGNIELRNYTFGMIKKNLACNAGLMTKELFEEMDTHKEMEVFFDEIKKKYEI